MSAFLRIIRNCVHRPTDLTISANLVLNIWVQFIEVLIVLNWQKQVYYITIYCTTIITETLLLNAGSSHGKVVVAVAVVVVVAVVVDVDVAVVVSV